MCKQRQGCLCPQHRVYGQVVRKVFETSIQLFDLILLDPPFAAVAQSDLQGGETPFWRWPRIATQELLMQSKFEVRLHRFVAQVGLPILGAFAHGAKKCSLRVLATAEAATPRRIQTHLRCQVLEHLPLHHQHPLQSLFSAQLLLQLGHLQVGGAFLFRCPLCLLYGVTLGEGQLPVRLSDALSETRDVRRIARRAGGVLGELSLQLGILCSQLRTPGPQNLNVLPNSIPRLLPNARFERIVRLAQPSNLSS
mmetsp:Transcript_29967/g.79941  ORF Transcript_29967/g.79941 Transcript_29967/m.79941 type:complete len:252 (-) Transcript_29967:152-907(-)